MNKEFVMRGKTASAGTEVLNFSGYKPGYAYRLVEFQVYPSASLGTQTAELSATLTAAKTYEDPANPNFNNEGLIGTTSYCWSASERTFSKLEIVNDTFLITQNLILAVVDTHAGAPMDVNWQCRFVAEKMDSSEEAVANFKQYTIFDG